MIDRVGQGSAQRSAAVTISAQRVLTVAQANALVRELAELFNFVQGLRVFAKTYRAGVSTMIGSPGAAIFCVLTTPGKQFTLAPGLVIEGGVLGGGHFGVSYKPVAGSTAGAYKVKLSGVVIASRQLMGYNVLPYIYHLPSAIYRAFGGFVDEQASSLLRSDLSAFVMTDAQRIVLNRIVSGDLKSAVNEIADTPIGWDRYALVSGSTVGSRLAAEADALSVIKTKFPVLHQALVLHKGVGVPVTA